MSSSGIFVVGEEDGLRRLEEKAFESEDDFQTLLERYPDLLPGEQINPEQPRRWLLVTREAVIADSENGSGRWAVDHLFVDQEAIPTFVEVKRRGDTRLRREVVGQMLDYAANAVAYWPQDEIPQAFEATAAQQGEDPEALLGTFLDEPGEADGFWDRVWTNLRAGKLRLLFVADHIPAELQRVIEFLNAQMTPAEVLGVELRHYAGDGLRTLVPRLVGKTAQSDGVKRVSRPARRWDAESVLADLRGRGFPEMAGLAQDLMSWVEAQPDFEIAFGQGALHASFSIAVRTDDGRCVPILLPANEREGLGGHLQYAQLVKFPPFDALESRRELQRRFEQVDPAIDPHNIERYPMFSARRLLDPTTLEHLKETLEWIAERLRRG